MTEFDEAFTYGIADTLAELFGDPVSIKRGSSTTASVTAQKLLGQANLNLEDGGTIRYTQASWIIAKADYQIASAVTAPRSGDRVIESDGAEWEIAPIDGEAETVEQPGGLEWLLRTKRVKAA